METRYRGWIPTVTGRLSFSHFGDAKRTKSARRSDTSKRYLVAFQYRKTGDALLPNWLQRLFRVEPKAYFVCIAQTEDVKDGNKVDLQGQLSGRVFIISDRASWNALLRNSMYLGFGQLEDYDQHSGATLESHFSYTFTAITQQCESVCAFQTEFSLGRNGVVDFSADSEMKVPKTAPKFDGPISGRLTFGLAHQCYSFLKDLGHYHKHHSPRNDTIVDLHPILDSTDDRSWRRKTLYGIYRRIITCMRREDILQQISSIGLLAYARTFKHIWIERYGKDEEANIPVFYDQEMTDSIRAAELRMRFKLQQRSEQNASFRTVLFSGVGLILSIAGLIKLTNNPQVNDTPARLLTWLASLLVANPLYTLGPAFAVAYFCLVVWPRHLKPHKWRALAIIQTLVQPFERSGAVSWLVMLGLVMLTLGLWIMGAMPSILQFIGWLMALALLPFKQ